MKVVLQSYKNIQISLVLLDSASAIAHSIGLKNTLMGFCEGGEFYDAESNQLREAS